MAWLSLGQPELSTEKENNMHSDKHNDSSATDLRDSIGHPIDRRDQRGHDAPGRWPASPGSHRVEKIGVGGLVSPETYHDRYPLSSPTPDGRPLPLRK
jgi:hypothetical protein